jgi:hypothetical protein
MMGVLVVGSNWGLSKAHAPGAVAQAEKAKHKAARNLSTLWGKRWYILVSICISSGKTQNELKKFYLEKNNQLFTLLYFTLILEAIAKSQHYLGGSKRSQPCWKNLD